VLISEEKHLKYFSMKSLIAKKILLLLLCSFFFGFVFGQGKIIHTDISVIRNHLTKADLFMKQTLYDSAVYESNIVLQMASKTGLKKFEADAYNILAEVMIVNGKMAEVRKYDSIMNPIALQLKDTTLIVNIKNRAGIYMLEQGRMSDAANSFLTALDLKPEREQSLKTAEIYSNLASVYMALSKRDLAMEWFFKALRLYEKLDSDVGQGETYSNISSIYYLMGRTDYAINFQKKSIYFREKQNDIQGLVVPNINIGQLYILKDSFALALQHLKQAVKYAERINNTKLKAGAYSGMSTYHARMKEYSPALEWQSKAIALFEDTDNKPLLSRMYVSAGNLANATNDSTGAVNFYKKALDISLRLGNKENITNAYEKMSNFYLSHNDYVNAYRYYKNLTLYKDSIAMASSLSNIEKIKIQYETEKKDNEITRLATDQRIKQLQIEKQNALISGNLLEAQKKENEIELLSKGKELQGLRITQQDEQLEKQILQAKTNEQQLQLAEKEKQLQERKLKNSETVRNFILAGIVLLAVLGYFLFNRFQLKKKLEAQAGLLTMRNNISQDLHDDIGASLSNINILNELARRNINRPAKSEEYISKASEDIQRISESLSDIVWNINPRYDDPENLFVRMKRYAADMLDGKNIKGEFDFPLSESHLTLSMTQRRDLYLIFKEAVNNLVKYSGAKNAAIKVTAEDHKIELIVKDDGKGFDKSKAGTGNGLHNMEQRAKASGAKISITSNTEMGTTVKLEMKIS
jgi:two-component system, NarL family, sensor histidine kinase UhpB